MRLVVSLLFAMILSVGCSASVDEKREETIKAVAEQMNKNPKDPNQNTEEIDYYLPFGFEVEEESPNNIILKNGSKTYILFYNQQENALSDVVYKSTLNRHEEFEIDQKWPEKNRFGYLLVSSLDEKDMNELIVGIGGVKLTSEVKTGSLTTEAAQMMEIVHSVQLKTVGK
jgi:hypothetical protein